MAQAPAVRSVPRSATPRPWNDPRVRAVFYQILAVAVLAGLAWYLASNTIDNIRARNIKTGFDFLGDVYPAQIDEALIRWDETGRYSRAFLIGVLNTLKVGAIGIVLATILGTIVGIARLSRNWLLAKLASGYVEAIRNVPLLLQLAFLYTLFTSALPSQLQALQFGGGFMLNKSGFIFPLLSVENSHIAGLLAAAAGLAAAIFYGRWARRRQDATGRPTPRFLPSLALIAVPALLAWLAYGADAEFEYAKPGRFAMEGGGRLTTEFLAILTGLVVYTAAFIAEIVRSGILAVSYGQTEAAGALGLTRAQQLRLVLLPQALRVVIPPMTSQFLNLIKNSSLGVAIGYPEIVAIANISINQSGRALECILIIMGVYLTFSLSIALFMNWYNRRVALVER